MRGRLWTCVPPVTQQGQSATARSSPCGHPLTQRPTRLLRATLWAREESPRSSRLDATEEAAAALRCVLTIVESHRLWSSRHCLVDPLWEVPAGEWMCPACGPGEWMSPVDDSIHCLPVPCLHTAASSSATPGTSGAGSGPALYKPDQHVITRPSWERHSSLNLPPGAGADGCLSQSH